MLISLLVILSYDGYHKKRFEKNNQFVINKDSVIQHIDNLINEWKEVRGLHLEVKDYKETINTTKTENNEKKFDLNFHNAYIKFIDGATASIQELRTKLTHKNFNF